jgi:hypothetical protein
MTDRTAERIFRMKAERRRRLAKLPFERKIEIVVELQKAVAGIRKDPRHVIWPISDETAPSRAQSESPNK